MERKVFMNRFYRNYNNYYYNTRYYNEQKSNYIKGYGNMPLAIDIKEIARQNESFRSTLWTGEHFQITLMNILPNESIGLEIHPDTDQFIQIIQGTGMVKMGDAQNNLDFSKRVGEDASIIIPAGKWHNLINIGNEPIKLFSIYAPPQHPKETVHLTKADAEH